MATSTGSTPTAAALHEAFAEPSALTVGLEEELMLMDPATHDLVPRVPELLERAAGDRRFKAELPAAQVEIAAPPAHSVGAGAAHLREARAELAALAAGAGLGVLGTAGTHPSAAALCATTPGSPYDGLVDEFADVIRRQLAFGLHVHVAVRPAERAIAVHDALRSHLPAIAALAANAPWHEGRDTGLASWRPKIAEILPRQGVPPVLGSAEGWARELAWATRAELLPARMRWWWELRLHPGFGTVEVRVADAQTTVGDAAAVAAFVHCLVALLAERSAAGEALPVHPEWRIAANRWSAARHGVRGRFADLGTGEPRPAAEVLEQLLEELAPTARGLGCEAELAAAHGLVERPPWERLRAAGADGGAQAASAWLAARFLE